MKKKILNGFLVAVMLLAGMSTFVSCKDYDEDSYNELKTALNKEISLREQLQKQVDGIKQCECNLKDYLTKLEAEATYLTKEDAEATYEKIGAYKAAIDLLQQAIDEINKKIADYNTAIDAINGRLDGVDSSITSISQQLNDMNVTILNVKAIAEEALELAKKAGTPVDLTPLENRVKALEDLVKGWNTQLKEVNDSAQKALALYYSLQAKVDANRYLIDSLSVVVKNISVNPGTPIDLSKYVTKDELEAAKKEALAKAEEARKLAQDALEKAIAAQISALAAQTAAEKAQNTADEALALAKANEIKIGNLQTQLDNFKNEYTTKIAEIEGSISTLTTNLNNLVETVNKLQDDVLKRMITGVIIQGTNNPMFGSISLPLDTRSMFLASYWGEYDKAVNFPYADDATQYYYTDEFTKINNAAIIYPKENVAIGTGRHLYKENSGEASIGKLYLTINPAEVDFAGGQPLQGLFTSGTETQAPVTIGTLQHSNTDLTFGVTRGANNGFYETDVKLNVADIDKARLQMNLKNLASDLKNVLNNRTKASVVQLAATFYNNIQDILPVYGAKVAWTDQTTGQAHSLYSQYNLGIMAIKPVSFNFADGISNKIAPSGKIPGFDRLQDLVGRMFKEVRDKIHELYPDINRDKLVFTFKSISIDKAPNGDIQTDADGNVVFKVVGTDELNNTHTYTLKFKMDSGGTTWLQELVDAINDRYGKGSDIDTAFGELVNTLDQIIQLETDLTDMVTDYENRVQNKITSVNNKLVDYIEYIDRALQPCMVGTTNNASALVSQSLYNPTKVTGSSFTLFPTSYTLELFAPAIKKFVAVTNVYNADGTQASDYESLAKAANGDNMAVVYDGREKCTLNGQAGYIYEVAYAALDFHGKICYKNFYVQFQ